MALSSYLSYESFVLCRARLIFSFSKVCVSYCVMFGLPNKHDLLVAVNMLCFTQPAAK